VHHGVFEARQGYRATGGLVIAAVGEAHRMWKYGGEHAFTIIPNFLLTGILAILVGLSIAAWSMAFLDRPRGSTVFLLLAVALLAVGGGVAQVVFSAVAWAVATRIHRRHDWLRACLPRGARRGLAATWGWMLAGATFLSALALTVAMTGFVPGLSDPERILIACWSTLAVALGLVLLAALGAFADDLEESPGADLERPDHLPGCEGGSLNKTTGAGELSPGK
jgi:hypothetical protein